MTKVRPPTTTTVHGASDEDWAEAVQKEAVIRPLAEIPKPLWPSVRAAAARLSLSVPRVYALVRAFRSQPITTSMLLRRPGQSAGARRLDPAIDATVEAAIDMIFLKPERPTVKRLFQQVWHNCLQRD